MVRSGGSVGRGGEEGADRCLVALAIIDKELAERSGRGAAAAARAWPTLSFDPASFDPAYWEHQMRADGY